MGRGRLAHHAPGRARLVYDHGHTLDRQSRRFEFAADPEEPVIQIFTVHAAAPATALRAHAVRPMPQRQHDSRSGRRLTLSSLATGRDGSIAARSLVRPSGGERLHL